MSIADVSKSLGELAKAVYEKSKELDDLKAVYNCRLSDLNDYIKDLPLQHNGKFVEQDDLMQCIKNPIKCRNCDEPFHGDYLLIPKSLIKAVDLKKEEINNKEPEISSQIRQLSIDNPSPSNKYHNKSKRICSYCHKQGHNRAKCFQRLNQEPNHQPKPE